jgi:hypothetical protein
VHEFFVLFGLQTVGSLSGIEIVLLQPIHDRLARDFELAGELTYATAGSGQFQDPTPELQGVGTTLCHGGFFLRKKESIHGTGSAPVCPNELDEGEDGCSLHCKADRYARRSQNDHRYVSRVHPDETNALEGEHRNYPARRLRSLSKPFNLDGADSDLVNEGSDALVLLIALLSQNTQLRQNVRQGAH